MRGRKLLAILLPIIAASTIVGTGFAVFHFYEGDESTSFTLSGSNVELEVMADKGTASIGNTELPTLVFSYYSIKFSDYLQINYEAGDNWGNKKYYLNLEATMDLSDISNFDDYITVGGWNYDSSSETYSISIENIFTATNYSTCSYVFSSWPYFSYGTNMRPTSTSELETMKAALKDKKISITFNLYLGEEVNSGD